MLNSWRRQTRFKAVSWTQWAAVAALLVMTRAGPEAARAADDAADVSVWVIRATRANTEVSPELKDIAEELKKQFKYTGFKLEQKAAGRVELGKAYSTSLLGPYRANVTPTRREEQRVTIKVEVTRRERDQDVPVLRTTFTIDRGRFQLCGGLKLDGSEDVLIAAVSAR